MYYNRRTIQKVPVQQVEVICPFDENGRLKKGFRYAGQGEIVDKQGTKYLISEHR